MPETYSLKFSFRGKRKEKQEVLKQIAQAIYT